MPAERALERRVVTALFADLAGFTTLGESLDPEDLRAVQDASSRPRGSSARPRARHTRGDRPGRAERRGVRGKLDGDPDRAREAARYFREFGAPWWLSKALR